MIRLAVIGLKHRLTHVRNICKLSCKARLVGICANHETPERLALSSDLGVPFYSDYQKMINETKPNGMIISTPNHRHVKEVLFCTENHIGVLIEKPIADTVTQGAQIVDTIKRANIPALIGYHRCRK